MEIEEQKILRFEDAICGIVREARAANKASMHTREYLVKLVGQFDGPWFLANKYRIPGLIEEVDEEQLCEHFHVCVLGMVLASLEERQELTAAACRKELVDSGTFSPENFEKYRRSIPEIERNYRQLVNESGVKTARILTDANFDLPLATPSFQGRHPTCTVHALAFCVSSQLRRLYGQAHAVKRDQILHVVQSMCKCWQSISVSEAVLKMKEIVCDNEDAWFTNDWGDRRLRISVESHPTDHDGLLAAMRSGLSMPCTVSYRDDYHMVCAVQGMRGGGENENKVMALNSWGHLEPVVVICKDEPALSDEYKLAYACEVTVRIVAVRGGNSRAMPTPLPRY